MKRYLVIITALVCAVLLAACEGNSLKAGGGDGASNRLVINGSTTVLPIGQKAVEVFRQKHPDVDVSISGSGSGDGIKALIDKTVDIAMSSREMKNGEKRQASTESVQPQQHVIAWDGIVPIVSPSNPLIDLTRAQLKDIYTGKVTDWKDIGGLPGRIVVVSRDSSSGTYEAWEELVLDKERVMAGAQLQASSGAVAEAIAKTPQAIGYVGIGYAEGNSSVKALTVDGVPASADTVLNKSYHIARPLYMYTNGEPKGIVAEFINFILGPEGRQLVKAEKFVPAPDR